MSELNPDSLPAVLREVKLRHLFTMRLDVRPLQIVGAMPGGRRADGPVHNLFEVL